MAKITTILSDRNIQTGSTGANATGEDFGSNTFAAMGQLAQVGEHTALKIGEIAKQQKEIDDNLWVGQNVEQHKNVLNEWMANPENQGKETFAQDFQNQLKDTLNNVKPPSTRAAAL